MKSKRNQQNNKNRPSLHVPDGDAST